MTAPQGLCYFAGIQSLLSAQFTLQHGISPSVATIRIPPQQGRLLEGGEMVWTYGGVRIAFPGCKVDRISTDISQDGREIWTLTVLDRRWRWRDTGRISGFYNTRRNEKIVRETEKTPQELARLCLAAMGEKRYDVSSIPNVQRPEIEWDYANPAQALGNLCDQLGCRVILKLDNSVSLERAGSGPHLPTGGDVLANTLTLDPPERPDVLVFVAGRTRYQLDLVLEPVAEDFDLRIKRLNELMFQPKGGWPSSFDPEMFNLNDPDSKISEWYKKSVYKWYRILPPKSVGDINRILPLENRQVVESGTRGPLAGGLPPLERKPLPAWVYGKWHGAADADEDFEPDPFKPDILSRPRGLYQRGITLDVERGIVKFNEPMYRLVHPAGPDRPVRLLVVPADLRLRVAVSLRDEKTRGWQRHEVRREKRGKRFGTLPRYILRDDIALHYYQRHDGRIVNNLKEVQRQADHYLDVAEREYQLTDPRSITYAGIKPIHPSGAVQQVTFAVGDQGFATTQASRNREEITASVSYKERRFIENVHETIRQRTESERTKRAKREKAES